MLVKVEADEAETVVKAKSVKAEGRNASFKIIVPFKGDLLVFF